MYPPAAQPPAPSVLKVRYKTLYSVLFTVAGALFLVLGLIALLNGLISYYLIIGVLFTVGGVLSFTMPVYSFDFATGGLYMHALFGYRARTYGAPKGERLWFDGQNVLRLQQSGKQRKVNLKAGNPEDVAKLVQVIAAAQQQALPSRTPKGPPSDPDGGPFAA